MKAVITVVGKDMTGIIAQVSDRLWKRKINVLDINQSIMGDMFVMVMLVEISNCDVDFQILAREMTELGDELCLKIHTMHEDIFNSMHRV